MTVGSIIERLKEYPADLRVVVSGYEGGYNDSDGFETIKIVLDYNTEWYYGKHENADRIFDKDNHNVVDALVIR